MGTQEIGTLDAALWESINSLALWIHRQGNVDDLQRGTLERLGSLIAHRQAMFDLMESDGHGGYAYVHPASVTMDPAALASYYDHYAALDYTTWSFDVHQVGVYRDLDLVAVERRNRTPIYQEWMAPQGLYFGCSATLAEKDLPLGSLTLFRAREAGDFSPVELRCLLELARHLSVKLYALYVEEQVSNSTSFEGAPERLARKCGLNPREREVLELMSNGLTNRQMSERLYISESTVKKHVNAIYRKLGVSNRMQLVDLLLATARDRQGSRFLTTLVLVSQV